MVKVWDTEEEPAEIFNVVLTDEKSSVEAVSAFV